MATATQTQQAAQAAQTAEEPLLDRVVEATTARLDAMAARYAEELQTAGLLPMRRAMLTATAIEHLEKALDNQTMQRFMRLMNSPLGFMTDRRGDDGKPLYSVDEVRRCIIDGLLRGFFPVNNEMNIIAGKFYGALNGYQRKVEEYPGIKNVEVSPGVPAMKDGLMCVRVGVSWLLDGVQQMLRDGNQNAGRTFVVSQNKGSNADNTIGKARRKAYKATYEFLSTTRIGDDDDIEPVQATAQAPAPTAQTNGDAAKRLKDKLNGGSTEPSTEKLGGEAKTTTTASSEKPGSPGEPPLAQPNTRAEGELSPEEADMIEKDRFDDLVGSINSSDTFEELAAARKLIEASGLPETRLIDLRQRADGWESRLKRKAGAKNKPKEPANWS